MKNIKGRTASTDGPLGPRLADPAAPLSASPAAILEMLRDQPEPVTQLALAEITGLHPNTVREHLESLVDRGLVARTRAEPHGRGRPAWLYHLSAARPQPAEYVGLAVALAASIARTSTTPRIEATLAGEDWGRDLAHNRGASPTAADATPETARDHVVELLDNLGFAPRSDPADPAEVRLTRCPLLEAAYRQPEVVCAVHLGIVRGALAAWGADPTGSDLFPFSEPGACRLVVPPRTGGGA